LLVIYDSSKRTEVWADASSGNGCVGAVLMQDHGKGLQPAAYLSKVMSGAEQRYPTFEQELLALRIALEEWRHYLLPIRFLARTDNNGIKFLKTQKNMKERQWRWLSFFSEYQFDLVHRAGAKMQVPDALSRRQHDLTSLLRIHEADEHKLEINLPQTDTKVFLCLRAPPPLKIENLQAIQNLDYSKDKELASIVKTLQNDPRAGEKNPKFALFELENGKLLWKDGLQNTRICIPAGQRVPLIKEYHDTPMGGHVGAEKVYHALKRHFYWPGMKSMIEGYTSTCDSCQKNKTWNQKPFGLPQLTDIPPFPWHTISVDFSGPYPTTKQGHDYIMTINDHLTKMALLIPTTTRVSALEASNIIRDNVIRRFGVPQKIISDRGPQFVAKLWKEIWRLLETTVALTAPYHPKSNAQTERFNRTYEEALRSFVDAHQDDWDERIVLFEFAHNDTITTTGYSPFFLNYGRHPTRPVMIGTSTNMPAVEEFVIEIQNSLSEARDLILRSQAKNAEMKMKDFQPSSFQKGDLVLLRSDNYDLQLPSRKLSPRWLGPFKIEKIKGPNTVTLELSSRFKGIEKTQNVSWIKPYKSRPTPLGPAVQHLNPDLVHGEEEYEVETILADRYKGTRTQYLVRFKSYGPEWDEWLPAKNLQNAQEAIKEYWARQKELIYPHTQRTKKRTKDLTLTDVADDI